MLKLPEVDFPVSEKEKQTIKNQEITTKNIGDLQSRDVYNNLK